MSEVLMVVNSDVKILLKSPLVLTNKFIRIWFTLVSRVKGGMSPRHICKKTNTQRKHTASVFAHCGHVILILEEKVGLMKE